MRLAGLYAITPDAVDSHILIERVRAAMKGGAPNGWAAVQYRNKLAGAEQRAAEARALASLCAGYGVPLIVNDDVELALAVGAEGAHLGSNDGDMVAARARLGTRLLGTSCYDRLDVARRAVAAGTDYVAFGSVFPSPTKPGAVRAPLALFAHARALGVPLVAIGGITLENAAEVVRAGADCVAVISGLFDAPDPAARARAFTAVFSNRMSPTA
ncbi:MAG TPA: thiamine phosphate synthase [Burkholderiales bacterium]|nr:thiamine phosphate synthase [Burkholderiales bacterium]